MGGILLGPTSRSLICEARLAARALPPGPILEEGREVSPWDAGGRLGID